MKFLYILCLPVLLVTLSGCGGNDGTSSNTVITISGNGIVPDFSIENLYGWQVEQETLASANQEDIVYIICPDDEADHPVFSLVTLSISTKQLEDGETAEDFVNALYENETLLTNDPKALEKVSFNNESGWTFQFKFTVGVPSVVDVYVFNSEGTMYILNATTTEELHEEHSSPRFEAMLDTFDIQQ